MPNRDAQRLEALADVRLALRHLGVAQAVLNGGRAAVGAEQSLIDVRDNLHAAQRSLLPEPPVPADGTPAAAPDEAMVAVLPTAILTTDHHGAVLRANAAALRLFDLGQTRFQHKPLFAFIAAARRRPTRALLSECVRTGRPTDSMIDLALRDGRVVPCHVWLTPLVVDDRPGGRAPTVTSVRWVLEPEEAPTGEAAMHAALVELCRLGVVDADLRSMLTRICLLAVSAVPGADDASVVLGGPEAPTVVAASSGRAQAADGLQMMVAEGPTLDAFRTGTPVASGYLAGDGRWPDLARRAPEATVGSVLCVPLPEAAGVITLYARAREALVQPGAEEAVAPFVVATEKLARDSRLVTALVATRDQLREALVSRAVIDQAKGIVMAHRGCDADEAFLHLRRLSNAGNRKLHAVARDLVDAAQRGGLRPPEQ